MQAHQGIQRLLEAESQASEVVAQAKKGAALVEGPTAPPPTRRPRSRNAPACSRAPRRALRRARAQTRSSG